MITLTPIHTDAKEYAFIEELMHSSFPEEERRNNEDQRYNTDCNPKFACYLITDEKTLVGFITVWTLDGFHYGEHLATSPDVRNKGYGKQIMLEIKKRYPGIFILEVERPDNEMSIRRIGFYRRCGFSLCEKDYIQPPYRQGGESVPLYLMFSGTDNIDDRFEQIRDTIYRDVYGVEKA